MNNVRMLYYYSNYGFCPEIQSEYPIQHTSPTMLYVMTYYAVYAAATYHDIDISELSIGLLVYFPHSPRYGLPYEYHTYVKLATLKPKGWDDKTVILARLDNLKLR